MTRLFGFRSHRSWSNSDDRLRQYLWDRLTLFFRPIPQFDIHLYSAYQSTGVGTWYGGFLEVLDGVRDVKVIEAAFVEAGAPSSDPVASLTLSPPVRFLDLIPLALFGVHSCYNDNLNRYLCFLTHHCRTQLPWSYFLIALGALLLALRNRALLVASHIKWESTLSPLNVMVYYIAVLAYAFYYYYIIISRLTCNKLTTKTHGSICVCATILRHLTVWKVFAPRFMAAVLELLTVGS